MDTNLQTTTPLDHLDVLLIGNNPGEIGNLIDVLHKLRTRKIITEIAFDIKGIFERLSHFRPQFIIIDDNIGKYELHETVEVLTHYRKTKGVPITVLKNSNYQDIGNTEVLDYVLKKGYSAESLLNGLENSFKFKRTQLYLRNTYQQRKRELLKLASRF